MNPKQIGIGILFLAIVAIAVMQFSNSSNNKAQDATQVETTVAPTAIDSMAKDTSTDSSMMAANYKDGTYKGTGNYTSPAQEEEVDITITLENGVVTDATFDGKATNETSMKMQGLFSEGFKEEVVGKPIDEIDLTVVNGSSLTPQGFMDALDQVKAEAKV